MNWNLEVSAAKPTAMREGRITRLIINLPPRHPKSLMASIRAYTGRGKLLRAYSAPTKVNGYGGAVPQSVDATPPIN